jgi:hypothetical protein
LAQPNQPLGAKTLQWRLHPEQRLRLIVERTTRQRSPSMDWTETLQYQVLWIVTGRDEDRIHLLQKLTEVKHTLQLPGTPPVVYDSSLEREPEGEATELARYWRPLLQVERPLTLSLQGRLIRTETPSAGAAGVIAAAVPSTASSGAPAAPSAASTPSPAAASAAAAPAAATPTTGSSGPSSTQSVRVNVPRGLADVHWALPTDELSQGDSWAESQLAPWRDLADAIKITTSYTYQGEEEVEQRVLDKIVVQARWDVQTLPAAPRQLTIERQSGAGVIYFDDQAGHLARAEFSQDLGLRLTPSQADPVQAEVSVALKIHCHPLVPEPPEEDAAPSAPAATPAPSTTGGEQAAAPSLPVITP